MRWLLFLSRLALICNFFFLLAFSLHFYNWTGDEQISSTIIILGYFMAVIINPVTVLLYLMITLFRKPIPVPAWLMALNILFLILQLLYIILLNSGKFDAA